MTNAERFVEKYKRLEKAVRAAYRLKDRDSIVFYLSKDNRFKKYAGEVKLCQSVRNVIQHEPRFGDKYPVQPSEDMLNFIDELIDTIENRVKVIQIATRNVVSSEMDGDVREVMAKMREKGYNHVPILEGGVVKGVFSRSSLFNMIVDKGDGGNTDPRTFADMRDYLGFEDRGAEEFIFVSRDMYVEELEELFEAEIKKARRVSAAFVTDTGDKSGRLLGMITPWDLFKA